MHKITKLTFKSVTDDSIFFKIIFRENEIDGIYFLQIILGQSKFCNFLLADDSHKNLKHQFLCKIIETNI